MDVVKLDRQPDNIDSIDQFNSYDCVRRAFFNPSIAIHFFENLGFGETQEFSKRGLPLREATQLGRCCEGNLYFVPFIPLTLITYW